MSTAPASGGPAPYGMFPTPYGIEVPVFRPDTPDPRDPEAVLFGMEGTAICAGIHDPAQRKRFIAEASRIGCCPPFEAFGGHPVPRIPLPRPSIPAYPRIPQGVSTPIEAWTTGLMDRFRWCDRAEFLVGIIGGSLDHLGTVDPHEEAMFCLGMSVILTGALEHVPEPEIDCIEAAAFYALTDHREWRAAGLQWLTPFRETWFRDWRDARPAYTRFAGLLAIEHDLPAWLGGDGSRRAGA